MTEQVKVDRTLEGKVVSTSMNKSIVVLIERRMPHPVYKKYITRSTRITAHDADNECTVGDVVVIKETKPFSKTKSWALVSIKESAA